MVYLLRFGAFAWWTAAAQVVVDRDYGWAVVCAAGMAFCWIFSFNLPEIFRRTGRHERSGT